MRSGLVPASKSCISTTSGSLRREGEPMYKPLIILTSLVATAAHAGMYDQPYAIVEMGGASEARKEARLAITSVDGASTRNPRQTDPIPPGKHRIALHFESARVELPSLAPGDRVGPRRLHALPHRRQLRGQVGPELEAQGLFRADRRVPEEIPQVANGREADPLPVSPCRQVPGVGRAPRDELVGVPVRPRVLLRCPARRGPASPRPRSWGSDTGASRPRTPR